MKRQKRRLLIALVVLCVFFVAGGVVLAALGNAPIDNSFGFDDEIKFGRATLSAWGVEEELVRHLPGELAEDMIASDHFYCVKKWHSDTGVEASRETHYTIAGDRVELIGEEETGDIESMAENAAATDTLLVCIQSERGIVSVARLWSQNEMPAVRLTDRSSLFASGLNFVTGSGYGLLVTEGENERGYQYLESSAEITENTAALYTEVPLPLTNKAERIYVVTAAQFQSSDPLYRQARTTIASSYQHNALFSDDFYNNSVLFSFDPTNPV